MKAAQDFKKDIIFKYTEGLLKQGQKVVHKNVS